MRYYAKADGPNRIHVRIEGSVDPSEEGWMLLEREPNPVLGESLVYDEEAKTFVIRQPSSGTEAPTPLAILTSRIEAVEAEIAKLKEARDAQRTD